MAVTVRASATQADDRFAAAIRGALEEAGWLPGGPTVRDARMQAERTGGELVDRLRSRCSPRSWDDGLAALGYRNSAPDLRRMLGLGACLSEYVTAPIVGRDPAVAFLGALANLIVALYDRGIDELGMPMSAITRGTLRTVFSTRGVLDGRPWSSRSPAAALLRRLIRVYAHEAASIGGWRGQGRAAYRRVSNTVVAMYAAEIAATSSQPLSEADLRRKSELPVVLLGQGAWLRRPARELGWDEAGHLRWAARVGELIGWLDDAVDFADDARAGRQSLLTARFLREPLRADEVGRYVAGLLASIERERRERCATCHPLTANVASGCLMATIASWLSSG